MSTSCAHYSRTGGWVLIFSLLRQLLSCCESQAVVWCWLEEDLMVRSLIETSIWAHIPHNRPAFLLSTIIFIYHLATLPLLKSVFIALHWQIRFDENSHTLSLLCIHHLGAITAMSIRRNATQRQSFISAEIITKHSAPGGSECMFVPQILHHVPLPVTPSTCSRSHLGAIRD